MCKNDSIYWVFSHIIRWKSRLSPNSFFRLQLFKVPNRKKIWGKPFNDFSTTRDFMLPISSYTFSQKYSGNWREKNVFRVETYINLVPTRAKNFLHAFFKLLFQFTHVFSICVCVRYFRVPRWPKLLWRKQRFILFIFSPLSLKFCMSFSFFLHNLTVGLSPRK